MSSGVPAELFLESTIETMVKKLNGETVPEKIYSPTKLITKENLSDAGKYYKDE